MAYTLCILGQILCMEEYEFNRARVLLEEAVVVFKTIEDRSGTAEALTALARLAVLQGAYEAARGYYSESWKLLQVIGAKDQCAACLEGYGEALLRSGASRQAVQLWGTAATVRAAIMAPIPPVYRTAYEQAVSFAREVLGDEAFQQAWIEGHRKSLEQVELPTDV
jgi:tetratricopeptide (TPR) repeat protein